MAISLAHQDGQRTHYQQNNAVVEFTAATRAHLRPTKCQGPREGFIPAETIVLNTTAGDYGTACGTVDQPVLCFLVG